MTTFFLNDKELEQLTGRKHKSRQAEWLKANAIPFRTSATGHPVVTRSAIEGRKEEPAPMQRWAPRVVGAR